MAMAMLFWVFAKMSDTQVMPAEVYGAWVTSYPAEWWAASIMLASAAYICGILINGAWRWSPALRVIGAAWHVITLSAFVVSAMSARYGDFFVLSSGVFAVVHMWFLSLNAGDLMRAVRKWNA